MIQTNIQNKLSGQAMTYLLFTRVIGGILLIILGVIVFSQGTLHGTSTVNGVTTATTTSSFIPGIGIIILGIIVPFWTYLYYTLFSYNVTEQSVTINSGILFRKSVTIDFNKIQNVDNVRGPLQLMFGVTTVNIWTSSQGQFSGQFSPIQFGSTNYGRRAIPKPDGRIYLPAQDAEDLKNYIAGKGAVQDVRITPPSAPIVS